MGSFEIVIIFLTFLINFPPFSHVIKTKISIRQPSYKTITFHPSSNFLPHFLLTLLLSTEYINI